MTDDTTPDYPLFRGLPLLFGTLGKFDCYGGRSLVCPCPVCGRENRHGWPKGSRPGVPQHRVQHCDCWDDGYYILAVAGPDGALKGTGRKGAKS
jgi:hypothetical protein